MSDNWSKSVDSGYLSSIKAIILDMDGVLWRENQPIGDLSTIFKMINDRGWKVTLATNNASRSIEQYLEKLRGFGVVLQPENIVTSAQATTHYLLRKHPNGGNVYVIGEKALEATLMESGFEICEDNPVAVIVSFDRQLTFEKLRRGSLLIRSGVPLIATNPDRTFPTPEGLIPGAGAILAAIVTATDAVPILTGKPEPEMYDMAMERMASSPETTLVVGDRLETDIAGAQKLGCPTALVLSGVTSPKSAQEWTPAPTWILPDLAALMNVFV
jgi:HAD superfamily hydrolase (TIGR01450 family)